MSDSKLYSAYPNLANQTLDWLPADTKQKYESSKKNPKSNKILISHGWTDKSITYKFNSYGFRCEEFVNKDSIVSLGCSHTIGIGIPYEKTFSYIVSKRLGYKNYNLALGAGSNDSCYRIGSYWIPKLKPKAVIYMIPSKLRFEYIDFQNQKVINLLPNHMTHSTSSDIRDKIIKRYRDFFIMNQENVNLLRSKNVKAIQQLCQENNIKFIQLDSNEYFSRKILARKGSNLQYDFGRDLSHRGPKTNEFVANEIISKYFA